MGETFYFHSASLQCDARMETEELLRQSLLPLDCRTVCTLGRNEDPKTGTETGEENLPPPPSRY